MRILTILFVVFSLSSCKNQPEKFENINSGFISECGTYFWGHDRNIIMKNIGDGGKIFAITNKKFEILYQQPINITFSDYHNWILYVDEKQNAYFYNGDYSETKALIWNTIEKKYDEINFCQKIVPLPKEFKNKLLDPTSNFKNCKSL